MATRCANVWRHRDAHKPYTVADFAVGNLARCYLDLRRAVDAVQDDMQQFWASHAQSGMSADSLVWLGKRQVLLARLRSLCAGGEK